jgi:hypothetical protein
MARLTANRKRQIKVAVSQGDLFHATCPSNLGPSGDPNRPVSVELTFTVFSPNSQRIVIPAGLSTYRILISKASGVTHLPMVAIDFGSGHS